MDAKTTGRYHVGIASVLRRCALALGCAVLTACASAPLPTAQSSTPPPPSAELVLSTRGVLVEGLGKEISFWRTEASALAAVTKLKRSGPSDVQESNRCRVHIWPDGLALIFVDGNFRGWNAPIQGQRIASAEATGLPGARAQAGAGCAAF